MSGASATQHRLILASAGTGKTFRLTTRYVELLLAGVEPRSILATTFTRQAAGEILERVLERLANAVTSDAARAELGRSLGRPLAREECLALLARLVRHVDRLQVRTIDAFFHHVVRLYGLDLGLPPDWTLVEDPRVAGLAGEAVALALEQAEPLEWATLLRDLQRGADARGVHSELLRLCEEGYALSCESARGAWQGIEPPPALAAAELEAVLGELAEHELAKKKDGLPHGGWVDARAELLAAAREQDWAEVLANGLCRGIGVGTYYGKTIEPPLLAALGRLATHAAHHEIAHLVRQTVAARALLERYARAYEELKLRRATYHFDDLARLLTGGAEDGELPLAGRELELWFRLDGRIDHLLLDEFQDTAPVQWRALRTIAEEILGDDERSFFCVGDAKQSIFGWREAEPRLLGHIGTRWAERIAVEPLDESWRSAPVVLDTVNRVFDRLDENPRIAGHAQDAVRRVASAWQRDFRPQRAAAPLAGRRGAVHLIEAPAAAEDEPRGEPALATAADRVLAIVRAAPSATVGVLVRRNKPIPRLLYLLRERGIRASGEGGNPLTDSLAVLQLVAVFRLADHPGDTAASFQVATSPFGASLGFAPDGADHREHAAAAARELRARLVRDGYGRTAAALVEHARGHPSHGAWDQKRLGQAVDMAYRHDAEATLRPSDFVRRVEHEGVEDPSAAQVQVMTVHRSKGLEFDAVVLPELTAERGLDSGWLTDRPDPERWLARVSRRPGKALRGFSRALDDLVEAGLERDFHEELCVLYVAMTRAKRRLDMIVAAPPKSGELPAGFAGLLRGALVPDGAQGPGVIWSHPDNAPDARCFEVEPAAETAQAGEAALPARWQVGPAQASRALPARAPSAEEGGRTRSARELLRVRPRAALERGVLIHRWLEEVEWLEDFARSDEALLALGARSVPDLAVRRAALVDFRALLARPRVAALLARPALGADELAVLRERRFALVLADTGGDEALWTGAFDRVVVRRRGGRAVHAEVLDFKTDRVEPDDVDARVAYYRPQLERYRRLAADMLALAPAEVAARLVFLEADLVCDV